MMEQMIWVNNGNRFLDLYQEFFSFEFSSSYFFYKNGNKIREKNGFDSKRKNKKPMHWNWMN